MEAGYNYNPSGNSTITVEFDNDGRDVYDILEDAGLGHLTDEIIYQLLCRLFMKPSNAKNVESSNHSTNFHYLALREQVAEYLQILLQPPSNGQT